MGKRNDFHVSFLTWNIYLGADLTPLIGGLTPQTVSQVFRQFLATNFPVRAKAIAREIASKKPDLIGLQEAERWKLAIPNFPIVIYDFVEILLDELKERGLHYEVAARNKNNNVRNIPDNNGNRISLLDRDVILIRKEKKLNVIKVKEENFTSNFNGILRGWSAVDVKLDGQVFRMINTHLEPLNPFTREAQAIELITGPANTDLPLILMGDLNSTPDSTTYRKFIDSGFHDVWAEADEGPGLTCCQSPDLLNTIPGLNRRIDYILFKNGWNPIKAELVGESQGDRTKTGLWPSDHVGVGTKFELDHHHHHEESSDESSS